MVNWPLFRKALSVGGNLYARLLLGIPVRDVTAGYRLFRRTTLEAIDLDSVESAGYCFQTDLAFRTHRAGLRVVEVPIEFVERVRGESKMNRAVATESLRRITTWGLDERRRQVRRRTLESSDAPRAHVLSAGRTRRRRSGSGSGPMRRRVPWWVLALLFVVVPVAEIYLLIQVGQVIGAWWTVLLLIADGFLGSWLMKREGARAWRRCGRRSTTRRMPAKELADGALILVGGTLLLTPGFLTDVVGLFCVLPLTRPLARPRAHPVPDPQVPRRPGRGPGVRGPGHDNAPDPTVGGPGRGRRRPERRAGPPGLRPSGLLLGRPVQVRRADLAAAQQLEPLGEDLLQLGDRAPLQEHVPVRAGRLLGLRLLRLAVRAQRLGAAARALPHRRDVGLDRHRDLELVPCGQA